MFGRLRLVEDELGCFVKNGNQERGYVLIFLHGLGDNGEGWLSDLKTVSFCVDKQRVFSSPLIWLRKEFGDRYKGCNPKCGK